MKSKVTAILLEMAFIIVLSGCTLSRGSDGEENWTSEDASKDSVFTEEFHGLTDSEEGIGVEPADVGETGEIIFDVVYVTGENGRTAQVLEGYLYGFWDGVLYRYDLETRERTVLYESVVDEDLDFCIYEGKIYFTERDLADTLTFMDTRLYQVSCDGSWVRLLQQHVPDDREEDRYARSCYDILVYEDIIYLKSGSGEDLYYWEAGTLLEYLEKHDASDRRKLSQEDILSYIRSDFSDVYRQVREVCGGSERWFVVEEECGNLEVIVVTEDGRNLAFDGGGKGLIVWEEGADCYFLSFEGDGYLVFPHLGEDGEVTELHTYGMMIDPYAGWRLWQRMYADGNIAKGWANYIVYY